MAGELKTIRAVTHYATAPSAFTNIDELYSELTPRVAGNSYSTDNNNPASTPETTGLQNPLTLSFRILDADSDFSNAYITDLPNNININKIDFYLWGGTRENITNSNRFNFRIVPADAGIENTNYTWVSEVGAVASSGNIITQQHIPSISSNANYPTLAYLNNTLKPESGLFRLWTDEETSATPAGLLPFYNPNGDALALNFNVLLSTTNNTPNTTLDLYGFMMLIRYTETMVSAGRYTTIGGKTKIKERLKIGDGGDVGTVLTIDADNARTKDSAKIPKKILNSPQIASLNNNLITDENGDYAKWFNFDGTINSYITLPKEIKGTKRKNYLTSNSPVYIIQNDPAYLLNNGFGVGIWFQLDPIESYAIDELYTLFHDKGKHYDPNTDAFYNLEYRVQYQHRGGGTGNNSLIYINYLYTRPDGTPGNEFNIHTGFNLNAQEIANFERARYLTFTIHGSDDPLIPEPVFYSRLYTIMDEGTYTIQTQSEVVEGTPHYIMSNEAPTETSYFLNEKMYIGIKT